MMRVCKGFGAAVIGALWLAAAMVAQTVHPAAKIPEANTKLQYSVVSVREVKPERTDYGMNDLPDGLRVRGATLQALMGEAYGFVVGPLSDQEIEGGPKWFKTTRFDIDAKVDDADVSALKADDALWDPMAAFIGAMATRTPTTRMLMLRAVLHDRFRLKVHDEVKTLPVYTLEVAKNGPKLGTAKDPEHGSLSMESGKLTAEGAPLVLLPSLLAPEMGRTVLDGTGLTGTYDFALKWTPNAGLEGSQGAASGTADAPGLLTALQEQLGLKLVAGKGPVHVTVIDSVEMPGEN